MQYTQNYNLKKPGGADIVDVNDFNSNTDIIDTALTPTASPNQVPVSNGPGKLTQWVSWIANRIKAITGKTNWYEAPDITLAQTRDHVDAANPHPGHVLVSDAVSAPAAGKILKMDSSGKLPTSITGDAHSVDGKHSYDFLQYSSSANTNGYFDVTGVSPTGTARLNYSGYFFATKVYNAIFNDYAEYFLKDGELEAGDVVCKSRDGEGYSKSCKEYSKLVCGVVSDEYAQCIGGEKDLSLEEQERKYAPVGMSGRVRVKVKGMVRTGDLLVSSDIPGVAIAAEDYIPGTVIGKALEVYDSDEIGRIKMLIVNC